MHAVRRTNRRADGHETNRCFWRLSERAYQAVTLNRKPAYEEVKVLLTYSMVQSPS